MVSAVAQQERGPALWQGRGQGGAPEPAQAQAQQRSPMSEKHSACKI
jgi:hypothetical protein